MLASSLLESSSLLPTEHRYEIFIGQHLGQARPNAIVSSYPICVCDDQNRKVLESPGTNINIILEWAK